CAIEYVSTDGGNTWQAPNLPGPGHVGDEMPLSGPFQVQGGWLFSQLITDLNGPAPLGYRLVKSSDGVNWQYADGALAAHSLVVTQFVVSARGGEIFAVSAPADGTNGDGKGDSSELWHSTNAGASWTDIGHFTRAAQTNYAQLGAVTINASNAVLLYSTAQVVSDGHQVMSVSADDGRTWQPAPTMGLPADVSHPPATPTSTDVRILGAPGPSVFPVGALADGSLVVEYAQLLQIPLGTPQANSGGAFMLSNSHVTYYALTPGASAWTPLTPTLGDGYVQAQWLAFDSAGKPTAIYTMQSAANANDPGNTSLTLNRCTLG
ncbi:MAG TPA: sialidase family protein, partial [Ktedonobacterales bacterium]|nr:sialidase family protein [Ktedonobacterales bacterium]